jgi:hypothetical protein
MHTDYTDGFVRLDVICVHLCDLRASVLDFDSHCAVLRSLALATGQVCPGERRKSDLHLQLCIELHMPRPHRAVVFVRQLPTRVPAAGQSIDPSQDRSARNTAGASARMTRSISESGRAVPRAREPTMATPRTSWRALAQRTTAWATCSAGCRWSRMVTPRFLALAARRFGRRCAKPRPLFDPSPGFLPQGARNPETTRLCRQCFCC